MMYQSRSLIALQFPPPYRYLGIYTHSLLHFDYLLYMLFPIVVLRTGFGFSLLQFLIFAFFLLSPRDFIHNILA